MFDNYKEIELPTLGFITTFIILKMYILMMAIFLHVMLMLDVELALSLGKAIMILTLTEFLIMLVVISYPLTFNVIVWIKKKRDKK